MTAPTDEELHAYVDDQLDPARRAEVVAALAEDPARAEQVRAWQRDAGALRAALGGFGDDNPALDPARIRARLRGRRRRRGALVGAFAACLVVGIVAGWLLRASRGDGLPPPMSDAVEAYRTFSTADAHLDLASRDAADTQAWLDRQFASAPRIPDLAPAGFRLIGARLVPQIDGPAVMVLYRSETGDAISFFVRQRRPLPRGERLDRDLLAQYGSGDHYSIAMVSHAGKDAEVARRALVSVGI